MDWEMQVSVQSWMRSVKSTYTSQLQLTFCVVRVTETGFECDPVGINCTTKPCQI